MKRSRGNSTGSTIRNAIRIMKRGTLLRKLLSLTVAIGLIPLFIFGLVSIFSANRILKDQTAGFQKQLVEKRKEYIDHVMIDIESLAANLSGIEDVTAAMGQSVSSSTYDRLAMQARIGYILNGYTNLEGLVSIDLFSQSGIHYHVGETLNATNIRTDLLQKLFEESKSQNGYLFWSGIENSINLESQYPQVIMAVRSLNMQGSDANMANSILVISYDPAVFANLLEEKNTGDGYSIIIDEKNRILYHPNQAFIGKTLTEGIANQISSANGEFVSAIDAKEMMAIYSKTQKGDWAVISFVSIDSIMAQSNVVTTVFSILLGATLLSTLYFAFVVSKQIVFPIKMVIDTFTALKDGELEHAGRLDVRSHDEIGELANLFNSFVDAREDITVQKKLERQLNMQNDDLQEALAKLKETQTQLISREKLAGIGQLAAGVAHEINNPLAYVTGNVDILGKYIKRYDAILDAIGGMVHSSAQVPSHPDLIQALWQDNKIDQIRGDIDEILGDTNDGLVRIANIVNGLKMFSRLGKPEEKTPILLNDCVKTTLLVVNNELKYNCDVQFQQGDLAEITVNVGQINQVLLNLLINAAHAIKAKHGDEKGLITIRTWADGMGEYCSIADDGCGMSDEVKKHIFEPFFTTKPVGQGTGLGLSITYDIIVNKHGGIIDICSIEGEGTAFSIFLPFKQGESGVNQ